MFGCIYTYIFHLMLFGWKKGEKKERRKERPGIPVDILDASDGISDVRGFHRLHVNDAGDALRAAQKGGGGGGGGENEKEKHTHTHTHTQYKEK